MEKLLEVSDLHVAFPSKRETVRAVDGVSFQVFQGETFGLVGESGCGKSVTASCIMQLLPELSRIESGSITYHSDEGDIRIDQLERNGKKMRSLRGHDMAMIFQDPMTALNPVYTIGFQIGENLRYHTKLDKKQRRSKSLKLLMHMGISTPEKRIDQYPHEFSGGMRQRVMIAMALSCNPRLIIADEPTTALDVTIQAQILDLLRNLKDKINSSIMLITHDLGVIAEMADYVVVMYAGRVVEKGTAQEIFANPAHPYTIGLMASKPMVGKKVDKLYSIPGKVPNPINMPNYCYFKDRCEMCVEGCQGEYPHMIQLSPTHMVSCYRYYGKEDAQNG